MKRILISSLIVLTTLVCCGTSVKATTINHISNNTKFYSNEKGSLLVENNKKELHTKIYNYNSEIIEKTYTFDRSIVSYAVYNNKIYVLYPSSIQRYLYYICVIENGVKRDLFHFSNKTIVLDCKMAVDGKGYFYIRFSNKKIGIFTPSGELIHTTDEAFNDIFNINNRCYGTQQNWVKEIGHEGVTKSFYADSVYSLYKLSDNYIIDRQGAVFQFDNDNLRFSMNIEVDFYSSFCESNDYIISANDNYFLAYDKKYGKLRHNYKFDKNVYKICCYDEILTVVYMDASIDYLNLNNIFKNEVQVASPTVKSSEHIPHNTSDYINKITEKAITVPQGTTATKLKDSFSAKVTYPENISGQLGTGDVITIDNKRYSVVIKGDITGEGNINSLDLKDSFNHLLNIKELENEFVDACDMNDDGKITNADLVLISREVK